MEENEIIALQKTIDLGIMLTQCRLVEKAKRENSKLVVMRGGKVVRVAAGELTDPLRIVCTKGQSWSHPLTVKYPICKAGAIHVGKVALLYPDKTAAASKTAAFYADKTAAVSAKRSIKSPKAKPTAGRMIKQRKK